MFDPRVCSALWVCDRWAHPRRVCEVRDQIFIRLSVTHICILCVCLTAPVCLSVSHSPEKHHCFSSAYLCSPKYPVSSSCASRTNRKLFLLQADFTSSFSTISSALNRARSAEPCNHTHKHTNTQERCEDGPSCSSMASTIKVRAAPHTLVSGDPNERWELLHLSLLIFWEFVWNFTVCGDSSVKSVAGCMNCFD